MSPAVADGWRPTASIEMLRRRARMLADIRAFFQQRDILEVETPVCSRHGTTDPAIESLASRYTGPGAPSGTPLYLHTSPEFPMKRLLAAGLGAIYQICKVFRDGESGRRHNAEFTLLEWYRPGFDHHQLMDEVEQLICQLMPQTGPVHKISYQRLFEQHLQVNPHQTTAEQLRQCALHQDVSGLECLDLPDRDAWLDILMTHCIEPAMGPGLCFVYDYPASQAALANIRQDVVPVAERFELYIDGIEVANGFHELIDATEQQKRFEQDLQQRSISGQPLIPMDGHLIEAMKYGLPECSGVALGIDRLLMQMTGSAHIDSVIAFPLYRA
ncbi:EF-P lysine aminoacylase EpmA [Sedimenticola selenatireducens]|uniref:EF-P lysine aminoacylase EpmA n=1 Tax=Sedimenticola selenatireducens TaxID=191960 RepID=UPI0021B3EE4B|nr:EF-P lysine aminoacylase EpmA [Sedimenticola selenatireducens]